MFRRRRRNDSESGDEAVEAVESVESVDATDAESDDDGGDLADASAADREGGPVRSAGPGRENGPWDVSEVDDPAAGGRVDLGGMWLPGRPGLEVRIEADQATSQVVAVTLVLGDSALQVQPFAAPRTEAIWHEVRDEIRAGITKQGGTSDEVEGPFGTELRTKVPVRAQDGSTGVQPARFLGIDGPRWFLRGMITACEKRPVSIQQLEEIADRVEAELQERPEREMSTKEIGAKLMQELKQLDQVAYVRFASVYRQFRDVGQFKREVDDSKWNPTPCATAIKGLL